MKNIVIIGGGTGTFTLLAGLRKFPSNNTVIVSSADDGGSTGVLRRELGVMPVGDIRQCLVGLSYTEQAMRDLFSYRFDKGALAGHAAGNIILAALEKTVGGIDGAIILARKMLNVRGDIIPITLFPTKLSASYADGKKVTGEHIIDEPRMSRTAAITALALAPSGPANPKALAAIKKADAIIFGPGDLFTSVVPNLLVQRVREAIAVSHAKKIMITNIMTKRGQTDGFRASHFVQALNGYLEPISKMHSGSNRRISALPLSRGSSYLQYASPLRWRHRDEIRSISPTKPFLRWVLAEKGAPHPVDTAIINNKKPDGRMRAAYRKQKAAYVEPDISAVEALGVVAVAGDFLARRAEGAARADRLQRSILRHDSDRTARAIWEIINHDD